MKKTILTLMFVSICILCISGVFAQTVSLKTGWNEIKYKGHTTTKINPKIESILRTNPITKATEQVCAYGCLGGNKIYKGDTLYIFSSTNHKLKINKK